MNGLVIVLSVCLRSAFLQGGFLVEVAGLLHLAGRQREFLEIVVVNLFRRIHQETRLTAACLLSDPEILSQQAAAHLHSA